MADNAINLVKLFKAVTKTMKENQTELNQADTYNHDHGDNMVEIFKVITQAMEEKKSASAADQLLYASQLLRQKSNSGSAQVYSSNLENAAASFQGKQVNSSNAMDLITLLMGAAAPQQQAPATSQDPLAGMLGSLLGGALGGGGQQAQQPGQQAQDGIDASDLLQAGMSFMSAKQRGASTGEALIGALLNNSSMSGSAHRQQSGALVANTLLQMLGGMAQK